jgi:hypothetical protein
VDYKQNTKNSLSLWEESEKQTENNDRESFRR